MNTICWECRKYHIEPLVTITHFDCPIHLIEQYGGWKNPKLIEFYKRLVPVLFTRFKGLVTLRTRTVLWRTITALPICGSISRP
ncbi:MAG: family 1 glycosylhydrolase [Clostridiales bacterium]|nr:family 1 glycosylhydrolase [Clostridiales bacterium]